MSKILKLYLKHNDTAFASLTHENGDIEENEGYLPYVGILGGDDTELKINAETGQILDWEPITSFNKEENDD